MDRLITALFLCLTSGICFCFSDPTLEDQARNSVVKVTATRAGGDTYVGSAVAVAPEKLVTNCHVLRYAREVNIQQGDQTFRAEVGARDEALDLCMLSVLGFEGATVMFGSTWDARLEQSVVAVGYPDGGQFEANTGFIRGLHNYQGGRVVQTSAPFRPGASGGALFDQDGHLLGILAFRATAGGDYHFVLPVEWVLRLLDIDAPRSARGPAGGQAFFEQESRSQPFFLQAAALEQRQNWYGLMRLAKKWSEAESYRMEPWLAMGKACAWMNSAQDAQSAFQRALELDPWDADGDDKLRVALHDVTPSPMCRSATWCSKFAPETREIFVAAELP